MKKLIIGIILLIVILPIAWYLASPLFIDDVVDEELPFELPDEVVETQTNNQVSSNEEETTVETNSEVDNLETEDEYSQATPDDIIERDDEVEEEMPDMDEPSIDLQGNFVDADSSHKAEGIAKVISADDQRILRFEDFKATNGPDLYVYLATDDSADDFVSLGELKGNIGNQNYVIDSDVDLEKYDKVLIWCQRFSVLFGTANLS